MSGGEPRRPTSFPDLVALLSDHMKEDRDNFEGMKRAFGGVEAKLGELHQKQDRQTQVLDKLAEQSEASAMERGRRVEREAQEKRARERNDRVLKWLRWVVVPLAVIISHLVTKYWGK
jgi:hypothetical protein